MPAVGCWVGRSAPDSIDAPGIASPPEAPPPAGKTAEGASASGTWAGGLPEEGIIPPECDAGPFAVGSAGALGSSPAGVAPRWAG